MTEVAHDEPRLASTRGSGHATTRQARMLETNKSDSPEIDSDAPLEAPPDMAELKPIKWHELWIGRRYWIGLKKGTGMLLVHFVRVPSVVTPDGERNCRRISRPLHGTLCHHDDNDLLFVRK